MSITPILRPAWGKIWVTSEMGKARPSALPCPRKWQLDHDHPAQNRQLDRVPNYFVETLIELLAPCDRIETDQLGLCLQLAVRNDPIQRGNR
jgi:hypothetical protein